MPDKPLPFTRSYLRENWDRTWRDWKDRRALVAFVILVLTFLGYGWIGQNQRMIRIGVYAAVAYTLFQMLIQTPWAMWNDARKRISEYRDQLRPRLSFVFQPNTPPFTQEFVLQERGKLDRTVRIWRVGIRNDSAAVIKRVRVVLEEALFIADVVEGNPAPPHPAQPALVEHALNVMGIDKKTGTVSVAPGDRPTAYIDVVEQLTFPGRPPDEWISLCYATKHRTQMYARSQWVLTLRVEGAGTYARAKFLLDGTALDGHIVMSPLLMPPCEEVTS